MDLAFSGLFNLNAANAFRSARANSFSADYRIIKKRNLTEYYLPLFRGNNTQKYSILGRPDVLVSSLVLNLIKWADVVYIPRFWYSAIPFAKVYKKPVIVSVHDYLPVCPLSTLFNASKGEICTLNKGRLASCPKCVYAHEKLHGTSTFETLASVTLNSTLANSFGELVKLSDAVVCVSQAQKARLLQGHPSLGKKTHVIYNPIRRLSSIAIEGTDFGYFGGVDLLKGFNVLFKAASLLVDQKNIKIHATNIYELTNKRARELREVRIIPYPRLKWDLFEKLNRRIRTVIIPSIWSETFSYVACEAAMRNQLVLASKIGAIPEMLKDCDGAFLFEPGNYEELAEKLKYVREILIEGLMVP